MLHTLFVIILATSIYLENHPAGHKGEKIQKEDWINVILKCIVLFFLCLPIICTKTAKALSDFLKYCVIDNILNIYYYINVRDGSDLSQYRDMHSLISTRLKLFPVSLTNAVFFF